MVQKTQNYAVGISKSHFKKFLKNTVFQQFEYGVFV